MTGARASAKRITPGSWDDAHQQLGGPLVVVWDGLLVWSHLKRSLANLAKRDISQLTALVKTRLRRMQYRPGLLDGFLACTGLDFRPLPYLPQLKIVLAVLPRDGCSRGVP